jgi:hypothetical protein
MDYSCLWISLSPVDEQCECICKIVILLNWVAAIWHFSIQSGSSSLVMMCELCRSKHSQVMKLIIIYMETWKIGASRHSSMLMCEFAENYVEANIHKLWNMEALIPKLVQKHTYLRSILWGVPRTSPPWSVRDSV